MTQPFFPAPEPPERPLARFLPPVGDTPAVDWLRYQQIAPPAWVLDPFGAAPWLTAALARAGYTVVVAAYNPILRFLIQAAAQPPARADLQAALAALAASRKGEERLQHHVAGLYQTTCRHCDGEVSAAAFIWERGGGAPFRVRYRCPHCHERGDHPAHEGDSARAMRFAGGGLHRARALERIAPLHDPDREHAERALKVYPARAVYVLTTLINRRPTLNLPPERLRALDALLLSALDAGNALWPNAVSRPRPRHLHIPTRYLEHNLWQALEEAVDIWADESPPVPCYRWPERPEAGGGVVLFPGRLRDLAPHLADLPIRAVCAVLPRPNQAFWALSALWAGWLWGAETVAEFKTVLRRQRYDWGWLTAALQAAWSHLQRTLPADTPCLTLLPELEPGFLTAGMVGLFRAGMQPAGLAVQVEPPVAQITWRSGTPAPGNGTFEHQAQAAVEDALRQAAQPLPALTVWAAALQGGIRALPDGEQSPTRACQQAQRAVSDLLRRPVWRVYEAREGSAESGLWWLREEPPDLPTPWFDRLERALVTLLLRQTPPEALLPRLCADFPGLLTPPRPLIGAVLDSYTQQGRLRPEDAPARRRADLAEMDRLLREIGARLGFRVPPDPPLRWLDPASQTPRFLFYLQASALLGRTVLAPPPDAGQPILVIPGGRATLVLFKRRHDPRLDERIARYGWRFLKFRLIRRLAELDSLQADALPSLLDLDPLSHTEPQLPLI